MLFAILNLELYYFQLYRLAAMALSSGNLFIGPSLLRSTISSQHLLHTSRISRQIDSSNPPKQEQEASSSTSPRVDESSGPTTAIPRNEKEEISFTTPGSSRYAEQDKKPISYLSAPLGIREKPISRKLTFSERRDRAFDYDRRMAKRKAM